MTDRNQIRPTAERRRAPAYSFALLAEFGENLSPAEEEAIAEICDQIPGGEWVKKRTHRKRYQAVDDALIEELGKRRKESAPLRIHDMAASNGITSLELFERLKHWDAVSLRATDRFDAVHVVRPPDSRWKVIFDIEGRPLQFVGKRMVIDARRPERKRTPINQIVRAILNHTVLPRATKALNADPSTALRVSLFHPHCIALARRDGRFTLGRDDIFKPAPGLFDVIRIMGVFRYDTDAYVARAVASVTPNLAENGLLVIGVNDGRETSIFQKRSSTAFEAIRDIGSGFDRRDVVLRSTSVGNN